ncbi:MAG: Polyribonucleotide nucleotidyltransferase [Candidatus Woesebacteria bacterium GW2011_GWA1_37_7]|uniref:Polyribonucleotide nucleotidyltransferase n=1 Tax=Candidatus Woesebacteria bacterium GW2011_GWA1_37_7 TaxID=1618545 RepID=A0A0G0HHC9_9BACT|nr:MAG: Polyribonucleotide nucleotidyltransferase [Candidatus Woesebacteria bacterium GW2011_GWA1_37_7]
MKKIEKSIELGGRTLTLSTGNIAAQANGAVMAKYGDTVVLATVVSAPLKLDLGYFPLTVDYQERLYAGGRIKGSRWVKREGRPTDEEILNGRLIDRSIRPLFPKEYKKDVQLIITVLSVDLENRPEVAAMYAASAAISISNIPWNGPVGLINVGMNAGKLIINPKEGEVATSDLDLLVSATAEAVVMIEAGANQVTEEDMVKAIEAAFKESSKVIKLIEDLTKEVNNKKEVLEKATHNAALVKKVEKLVSEELETLIKKMASKEASYSDYDELKHALVENFEDTKERQEASQVLEELYQQKLKEMILSGKRPDGRKHDEIRSLSAEVGVLPRTHGSAIFERGQTQALSITTLGGPSLEQSIETAQGEETKRYIHHYSMPPYSTGETGKVGSPSRREIGHGALAERALIPVIPSEEEFPYTIRVVTEILSSNGSTSMASTCGSTLSLMDAGVPIKAAIGGIAMGLIIKDAKTYSILTDIVGIEDGNGDMDFKVAGSKSGITALQLDVKTTSLTIPILKEALLQARKARLEIIGVIEKTIDKPRPTVSQHAPKIILIKIPVEKIGEVIGPGGRMIKSIIAETGALIEVEDDGSVNISGMTDTEIKSASDKILGIVKEAVPGEIYEGVVKRIQPFGAFVEILPGKEGLVHVSDMSDDFVKDPNDFVKIGDKKEVRVKEIDDLGRINLSMLLDPAKDKEKEERRKNDRGPRQNNFTRGRFDRRGGRGMGGRNQDQGRDKYRSSGPHFPTSRLLGEDRD